MFIDIVLGGSQLMLLWMKLHEQYNGSWWLVILPSIIWALGGVIASMSRKEEYDIQNPKDNAEETVRRD